MPPDLPFASQALFQRAEAACEEARQLRAETEMLVNYAKDVQRLLAAGPSLSALSDGRPCGERKSESVGLRKSQLATK